MKKLIIPLLLGVFALASCQNNLATAVYIDNFRMPLSELREDTLIVNIMAEYPIGTDDASVTLWAGIMDCLFGYGWDTDDCTDSIALYYRNAIVDEYMGVLLPMAADTSDHSNMSWETSIDGHFLSDWNGYHRYEENIYEYRGGAHGLDRYVAFVFDSNTGKRVEEHEFFKKGYEEPVKALLCKHLVSDFIPPLKEDGFDVEEMEREFSAGNGVDVNGVYLPGPNGVTWFFDPEYIAFVPYSYGVISVTIPWEEIQDWVR